MKNYGNKFCQIFMNTMLKLHFVRLNILMSLNINQKVKRKKQIITLVTQQKGSHKAKS